MTNKFLGNKELLNNAKKTLANRSQLYWVVGGSGSGKTTICQALANQYDLPIYDMDAHIYGEYHGRFLPERHPVNSQWAAAPNGFAWLMEMSWAAFDAFNKAAVPEYLDLLAEDLAHLPKNAPLLIDGGIVNPAIAAQAIPPGHFVSLDRPGVSSATVWSETEERLGMKAMIEQLPDPDTAWQKFLEFDGRISQTIREECKASQIPICIRSEIDTVDLLMQRVANALNL